MTGSLQSKLEDENLGSIAVLKKQEEETLCKIGIKYYIQL